MLLVTVKIQLNRKRLYSNQSASTSLGAATQHSILCGYECEIDSLLTWTKGEIVEETLWNLGL